MAKKRTVKNKRNKNSWGFFFILILIFAALIIYSYKTNPDFKEKADNLIKDYTGLEKEEIISEEKIDLQGKSETPPKKESPSPKKMVDLPPKLEIPACKKGNDHQIRNFNHYSICYRESYEQAEWSAYCLTEDELIKNSNRSDDFRSDPQIVTGSASPSDYKKSGYDRGHLAPAADFAFNQEAMSETFYMSNMTPQAGSFNRGIWKDLESSVRDWAMKFSRIYVISGPLLEKSPEVYKSIGENKVCVPEYYYKVILIPLYKDEVDKSSPENAEDILAAGFLFPNQKCDGGIFDYAVAIDEIEKRSGLDFFHLLSDEIENKIESNVATPF